MFLKFYAKQKLPLRECSRIIFSFLCIATVGVFTIFFQTRILPSDRVLYQKLVQETASLRSSKSLERHPAFQLREHAQKDIWTMNGTQRTHFQMHSHLSKLSLKQKKDKIEANEDLKHLTCISQIGFLKAEEGAYHYPNQDFTANQIECTHLLGKIKAGSALLKSMQHLALNHQVSLTASREDYPCCISSQSAICEREEKKNLPFLEQQKITFFNDVAIQMLENLHAKGGSAIYKIGSLILYPEIPETKCHLQYANCFIDAEEIHFNLAKETILCQKAQGKIPTENKNPWLFSAKTLLWQKENETIECIENVHIEQAEKISILSDSAKITLKNNALSQIELNDNIRLFSPSIQNKNSFALADKIFVYPDEQTLVLSAIHPKRVLFWQEGIALSAPEILIQKDPLTKEESIQGKGDIHCTFTSEEQNIINKFISNYLNL